MKNILKNPQICKIFLKFLGYENLSKNLDYEKYSQKYATMKFFFLKIYDCEKNPKNPRLLKTFLKKWYFLNAGNT